LKSFLASLPDTFPYALRSTLRGTLPRFTAL